MPLASDAEISTIRCDAPLARSIADLLPAFRAAVLSTCSMTLCRSGAPQDAFRCFFDTAPALILQLEGARLWRIFPDAALVGRGTAWHRSGEVPPARRAGRDRSSPSGSEGMECTLTSGEALFVPAGRWHAGRALGAGVHLTLVLPNADEGAFHAAVPDSAGP